RAALAWYGAVRVAIESLDMFPERCPLAPENGLVSREIRQLLLGKSRYHYRILFTIKGKSVHVLHILHGARAWLGLIQKESSCRRGGLSTLPFSLCRAGMPNPLLANF